MCCVCCAPGGRAACLPHSASLGSAARPWRQRVAEPHHPPPSARITPRRDTVPDNNKTYFSHVEHLHFFSGLCKCGTMQVLPRRTPSRSRVYRHTRGFNCWRCLKKKKVAVLSVLWKRFKRGPHFQRRFKNIAPKGGDSVDISHPGLIKQPAPKFSCFKDSTLPAKIM